jgi:hypothetical protein
MRTVSRTSMAVMAAAALGALPVQAQPHVSFGIGIGSIFTGVGFGVSNYYGPSSLFVGASFDQSYGIYSSAYDGYRGARNYHYRRNHCWDSYWDSYWDPYSGWYTDCVSYGPISYTSFRARRWRSRWGGYRSNTFVYVSDHFSSPWHPYWAYDPWGSYWNGYDNGLRDGYYSGRGVYTAGRYRGTTIYRPSPLTPVGPAYKETPGGSGTRTAVRRAGSAAPVATPVRAAAVSRGGAQTSSRPTLARTGLPRAGSARTASPTARSGSPTARTASPSTRPSDRVAGVGRRRPGATATRGATSRPSATGRPTAARAPTAASRPRDRVTPRSATSRHRTPSTRSAPSRQSAPSARSATSRPGG